jgi:hypothetical protein
MCRSGSKARGGWRVDHPARQREAILSASAKGEKACPLPQPWYRLRARSYQIETALVDKDPVAALAGSFSHNTQLLEIRKGLGDGWQRL